MPMDALVKQNDKWVPIKGLDHAEIKAAKDGSKDYAEFTGFSASDAIQDVFLKLCVEILMQALKHIPVGVASILHCKL